MLVCVMSAVEVCDEQPGLDTLYMSDMPHVTESEVQKVASMASLDVRYSSACATGEALVSHDRLWNRKEC